MLATESGIIPHQPGPWGLVGETPDVLDINHKNDFAELPFINTAREFSWTEQEYHVGDTVALVAVYKNLPHHLQHSVDQLILEEYKRKLFRTPLFEASLLLLSSGCLPENFRFLSERAKQIYPDGCFQDEQQKALDFISCRNPEDIVVLVMRSGQLIATMTLFPFNRKQDIPSLTYLSIEPSFDQLPDVPGVAVGRLAKATFNGHQGKVLGNDLTNTTAMAAAIIIAIDFAHEKGLFANAESFICGESYGCFISSLKRFFPLRTFKAKVNPNMLEDYSESQGMGMYFIQRQVLGAFKSADELISVIETIGSARPELAHRIKQLLESDLKTNGFSTIRKFDPQKFRVQFFSFPYHHQKVGEGLKRLDQMVQRLETRTKIAWH